MDRGLIMNIGEKIKLLRKERGLTQKQLADAIHKSEITVRKYEANDISITFDVLQDILEVLDSNILIETKDYSTNLLRQYIDSLNLDINDEQYHEIELFIENYILFKCDSYYNNILKKSKRINNIKKNKKLLE